MGSDVTLLFVVIAVVVVALVFDFTNGFHDSANAMAGPIATGALRPRTAVIIAAVLNLVGALLSTEVAKTISGGFFDESLITAPIILAGLVGAIIWNLLTWLLGLPSSSSHALFGGLIGAVIVGAGISTVHGSVIVSKVLLPALVAPLVAGVAAAVATRIAYRITRRADRSQTDAGFKYGQAFTASLVALAHGTSDGQKTMGVITLVLVAAGLQQADTGPQWWVIIAAGVAIGLGTYSGGWRIMRTMGKGIVEIETPQGAASGAATTATILASSHLGFGLSTTHVSTGSILGSGVGREGAEVRWSVARRMVFAWVLTLPAAGLVGGLSALVAEQGTAGVIILLVLLALSCGVIYAFSRRHRVDHENVTDSAEVMVFASARNFPAARPESEDHDHGSPTRRTGAGSL
ncbi:MAG: Probable low-affinity inorganic phosphate transporter [uncultured Friedmanniella sp.]|uniref:Phosphate transporter n=1 Tax=uncultured Friedmanniella sp. TaxID=335381 RepID=A0A6J4JXQ2_9ACTN|nr:MAG: Probable low-affinity inorganic phosphate transporter [uncultured Friedmanniella sp.]